MKPIFLALALALLPSLAVCQDVQQANKFSLVVVVPDQLDAQSNQILQWFASDPQLSQVAKACYYQLFTPSNTLYRERYARSLPPNELPIVALVDHLGRVHFKVSGPATPATASDLLAAMHASLNNGSQLVMQYDYSNPNCPDGRCPNVRPQPGPFNPNQPDFGPSYPIPNTIQPVPASSNLALYVVAGVSIVVIGGVALAVLVAGGLYFLTRNKGA